MWKNFMLHIQMQLRDQHSILIQAHTEVHTPEIFSCRVYKRSCAMSVIYCSRHILKRAHPRLHRFLWPVLHALETVSYYAYKCSCMIGVIYWCRHLLKHVHPSFCFFLGLCCTHVKYFHISYRNTAARLALYISPGMDWSVCIPFFCFFWDVCCMHMGFSY